MVALQACDTRLKESAGLGQALGTRAERGASLHTVLPCLQTRFGRGGEASVPLRCSMFHHVPRCSRLTFYLTPPPRVPAEDSVEEDGKNSLACLGQLPCSYWASVSPSDKWEVG